MIFDGIVEFTMETQSPTLNNSSPVSPVARVPEPHVLKKFPGNASSAKENVVVVVLSILVVGVGVLTGWLLSGSRLTPAGEERKLQVTSESASTNSLEEGQVVDSQKYGEVEGVLVKGGIKGEGTHHIERDNNPARYVYLSSTVIDLDKYTGKKVKIWGETISSVNAPWLMDVVKIKTID